MPEDDYSPTAYMEINTDAAREMGIEQMDYVRLVSRRGDAVVMAQLTQRVPYNMVFVPFHFYDDGRTVDRMPLERFYGPAVLVDLAPGSCLALSVPTEGARPRPST